MPLRRRRESIWEAFLLTRVEAPRWKALRSALWKSSGESSPALKEMRFMPTAWGGASGLRGGFVM
ncbi:MULTISPECIES: hypothetical protein [unclassified Akkermansia]|uniref:hypothetical protein n=1 Tax=unclassified Akkermansia TaxID=2608915 RepID=UPI001020F2B2|nr:MULTISPECIES: hypothetical protein [unclassified Akkermansia]KAA3150652.1 hypothetical protein F2A16_00015 [Akkermansia sp. BIOML-A67]KAA3166361.1 hypothetical protein F2A23_02880 [Akkermansia sp. BIOML-A63]KAA3175014.1 hypothetical protein F2A07_00015 [Akkermansia sp. BIOML-A61]KAA3185292.1 hypothetical protein F1990_03045 [Akkermansia sp. BIOML-A55]KAA3197021.1 hypothetical protein F2A21_00015 [Akkermansia sp. BIOML-A54]KAA3221690.1 hypothetical protein F1964_02015 [Akkermansia sp. BIOML